MKLRIETFNIWGDYFGNPVDIRLDGILFGIEKNNPDILGIQESTASWYKSGLYEALSDYTLIGYQGNFVPLLFKTGKFFVMNCGFDRYRDTDDITKGITWARLRDNETGKLFGVLNTHFWWMAGHEHDLIREKNAIQLAEKMDFLKESGCEAVFSFGDFNCNVNSSAMAQLKNRLIYPAHLLTDDYSHVRSCHGDPLKGDDGLYYGKKSDDDESYSIDHIMTFRDCCKVKRHFITQDEIVLNASDHSPVVVDVEF